MSNHVLYLRIEVLNTRIYMLVQFHSTDIPPMRPFYSWNRKITSLFSDTLTSSQISTSEKNNCALGKLNRVEHPFTCAVTFSYPERYKTYLHVPFPIILGEASLHS